MIVTFCGHSDFLKTTEHEKKFLDILSGTVGDHPAEMYLGDYGAFDHFALSCCGKYKENHPNITLVFVTPYLNRTQPGYDTTLYPPLENVPPRFAISRRNKYMVECANIVIAYITHDWGGAYATYEHAKRKGKVILNLADPESFDF